MHYMVSLAAAPDQAHFEKPGSRCNGTFTGVAALNLLVLREPHRLTGAQIKTYN